MYDQIPLPLWKDLSKLERTFILSYLRCLCLRRRLRLPLPARFALTAALFTFAFLFLMPHHPLAIPAAYGLGLSFALLLCAI